MQNLEHQAGEPALSVPPAVGTPAVEAAPITSAAPTAPVGPVAPVESAAEALTASPAVPETAAPNDWSQLPADLTEMPPFSLEEALYGHEQ